MDKLHNLRRLLRAVRDLPEDQFDMSVYAIGEEKEKVSPGCGTACCLAGTAASILPNYRLEWFTVDWEHEATAVVKLTDLYSTKTNCEACMATDLGISEHLVDDLFTAEGLYGRDSLDDVTKQDVMRVLAYIISEGVTDWTWKTSNWDEFQNAASDPKWDDVAEKICEEVGPVWETLNEGC